MGRLAALGVAGMIGLSALGGAQAYAGAGQPNLGTYPPAVTQCEADPSLVWCKANLAAGIPDVKILKAAEMAARRGFSYDTHAPADHPWKTDLPAAESGDKWTGDCNDLSETIVALAVKYGFPSDHIWRVVARDTQGHAEGEKVSGHQFGVAKAADGTLWVIGDANAKAPYQLGNDDRAGYTFIYINKVSDGPGWSKAQGTSPDFIFR